MDTQMQNKRGEWVLTIPVPSYLSFGRTQCSCKRKFWGSQAYKEHYVYAHISMDELAR